MRKINFLKCTILLFVLMIVSCKQNKKQENELTEAKTLFISKEYDSIAAKKFGADDYGMKKYVMAFLKIGPNQSYSSKQKDSLQKGHMDNIIRLANEKKLVLAGPFFGNDELRGIFIFDVQSIGEAEKLTNSDPAIQAGTLTMELKEWFGTAALIPINEIHKSIAKLEE